MISDEDMRDFRGRPRYLHSVNALELIGFETETANAIFANWARYDDMPEELLDFALAHLDMLRTERYRAYSTVDALRRLGINSKTRDAITDPDYAQISSTQTLHYWVRDTIRGNYRSLVEHHDRLMECANPAKRKEKSRESSPGVLDPAVQLSEISVTTNVVSQSFHLPTVHVSVQTASRPRSDHYVLYKGLAPVSAIRPPSLITEDGAIDMNVLSTYACGDFNADSFASYWTPDRHVAEGTGPGLLGECPLQRHGWFALNYPRL